MLYAECKICENPCESVVANCGCKLGEKMGYEKFIKQVDGNKKNDVMLFTLTTCGWCQKTKKLLNELGVGYRYVDVDLLEGKDQQEAQKIITRWNPRCSFPTLVINNTRGIIGFQEDQLKELADNA
jgi:glutaredoxin